MVNRPNTDDEAKRAAEARIKKNELMARDYEAEIRMLKARDELQKMKAARKAAP